MVRRKHIRELVQHYLAEYTIDSAPVDVAKIAKGLGVEVQEEPAEEELSGFLYREQTQGLAIIGVNANHPANRRNFTTAHELGHFLLHDFDDIHVDRQFSVWLRSPASSRGTDVKEMEANFFAAELLMPKHFLAQDIQEMPRIDLLDEKALNGLAAKYKVSAQAMTFRLMHLGYIQQ